MPFEGNQRRVLALCHRTQFDRQAFTGWKACSLITRRKRYEHIVCFPHRNPVEMECSVSSKKIQEER
ncbi:hypothetical protein DTO027B5_5967 [Paecilomyces variotii]|nr:hypothetical protein DTO169C6_3315 [Paecilomyces variotii]KAJ9234739.1 hypothetical protein DTO169E5_6452 [Paecilomyces variotii]KAJ9323767.1 hypothetical protein DTO027B3_5116 [Paecilomyces variotii]KAJ9332317.1 hypothetical protein DTO027B5_5967 [Paecilomyces variotii]KAJ9356797.1 hypothetical protein DTO027B9_3281 [Paecilomyces variotii]